MTARVEEYFAKIVSGFIFELIVSQLFDSQIFIYELNK